MPTCAICGHTAKYLGIHAQRVHGMMPAEYRDAHGALFDAGVVNRARRPAGWAGLRDAFEEMGWPDRVAFIVSVLGTCSGAPARDAATAALMAMPYTGLLQTARTAGVPIPVSACQECLAAAVVRAMAATVAAGGGAQCAQDPDIAAGLSAWTSGKAYLDNNGNYRVREEGQKRRIAPWNRAMRTAYPEGPPADIGEASKL